MLFLSSDYDVILGREGFRENDLRDGINGGGGLLMISDTTPGHSFDDRRHGMAYWTAMEDTHRFTLIDDIPHEDLSQQEGLHMCVSTSLCNF
jgi:hypothetical protein